MKKSSIIYLAIVFLIFISGGLFQSLGYEQNPEVALESPSFKHWFGLDPLGRDLFYRVFAGAYHSILFGVLSGVCTWSVAIVAGSCFAWNGGLLDKIFIRFADVIQALPNLLVASVVVLGVHHFLGVLSVPLGIALAAWPLAAKVVRGLIYSEKSKDYIAASRSMGASSFWIITRHIIPNVSRPILVFMGLQVSYFLVAESLLSFVGVGLQAPIASLGVLIQEGWKNLFVAPHLMIFPSLMLFIIIYFSNLLFESLGPQLRSRPSTKNIFNIFGNFDR